MRASTSLVSVLVLSTLLAGCGSGVDTAKKVSNRHVVAADDALDGGGGDGGDESTTPATSTSSGGGGGISAPKSGDDAFTAENLRLIDPCALMPKETLSAYGEPAENRLRDYGLCSNYMKRPDGKDLNFTLTVGELASVSSSDTKITVGGLPGVQSMLDGESACFLTALTEKNPDRGITIQTGGEPGNQCEPGKKLLETIVNNVRAGAKGLPVVKGTMAGLKPCEIVDQALLTKAMGGTASPRPSTLHSCNFSATGVSMSLSFKLGYKPEDMKEAGKTKEVDLGGGVTGYQESDTSSGPRCTLEWTHVPFPADAERAEVVNIDYSRYSGEGGDPCAATMEVAKAVIAKLPAK